MTILPKRVAVPEADERLQPFSASITLTSTMEAVNANLYSLRMVSDLHGNRGTCRLHPADRLNHAPGARAAPSRMQWNVEV